MKGNARITINDGIDFESYADVRLTHNVEYAQATLSRGEGKYDLCELSFTPHAS